MQILVHGEVSEDYQQDIYLKQCSDEHIFLDILVALKQ